jgi:hypothetical protein
MKYKELYVVDFNLTLAPSEQTFWNLFYSNKNPYPEIRKKLIEHQEIPSKYTTEDNKLDLLTNTDPETLEQLKKAITTLVKGDFWELHPQHKAYRITPPSELSIDFIKLLIGKQYPVAIGTSTPYPHLVRFFLDAVLGKEDAGKIHICSMSLNENLGKGPHIEAILNHFFADEAATFPKHRVKLIDDLALNCGEAEKQGYKAYWVSQNKKEHEDLWQFLIDYIKAQDLVKNEDIEADCPVTPPNTPKKAPCDFTPAKKRSNDVYPSVLGVKRFKPIQTLPVKAREDGKENNPNVCNSNDPFFNDITPLAPSPPPPSSSTGQANLPPPAAPQDAKRF